MEDSPFGEDSEDGMSRVVGMVVIGGFVVGWVVGAMVGHMVMGIDKTWSITWIKPLLAPTSMAMASAPSFTASDAFSDPAS